MINKLQLYCQKLQRPLPVQKVKCVHILPMQIRQIVISRAHATFAEVTKSVKTFQEHIEVDTVSHDFKNVTFSDVGCTLCHESHKSLDCPSLCSIIEMEVSSSASPPDSSSNSDSRSCSPNRDLGLRRRCYMHESRSKSRSPRRFDRGYLPEIDYSHGRDYHYRFPDRNNIKIDSTILVITVGDIISQMVSSRMGAIVKIVTQINIKTGKFKAATRVAIKEIAQITITMRIMVATRGLNVIEKNQYRNQQQNYQNNQPGHNYGH